METYQSAKEEIRRAVDIVDLIGQFVRLKKAGQNYVGLCPFHSEKDPSFTVSPSKAMFHCFGCKKGGDVFAFWMEYYKMSFAEAMRDLAEKYHIPLPKGSDRGPDRDKGDLKRELYRLNQLAAEYYHHALMESKEGGPCNDYLEKRGISKDIVREFKIGFAPNKWDGLTRYLTTKNEDMEKAVQAGLIISGKKGGYYDRFRGRVIFPILDLKERVVGFGARVLDNTLPKYINTPDTPIFHKGELLYGLHAAHRRIREAGRAVIVEGYTDVLSLRLHGFNEAVATLGTALTNHHIRALKGYAREAIVIFDSDTAGRSAALKSLSHFLKEGLPPKVVILPEKEDPDSFVNKHGVKGFLALLEQGMPMFDYYLDSKLSGKDDQIEAKLESLQDIFALLADLKSEAQRSFYVRRIAGALNVSETAISRELQKSRFGTSFETGSHKAQDKYSVNRAKNLDDCYLLNIVVHHPDIAERLLNKDIRFLLSDPLVLEIFQCVVKIYKLEGKISPESVLESLETDEARGRLREALMSPSMFSRDMAQQAVTGFEDKIQRRKLAEEFNKAGEGESLEVSKRILEYKRNRQIKTL
ncbi:MAG: DNA primase [Deltaproteobacteria bacterium]|nr:DNA primase [Deltaproteobacteria bacterium]